MSRPTRDGTAEPVSRDQFSGAYRDRGIFIFHNTLLLGECTVVDVFFISSLSNNTNTMYYQIGYTVDKVCRRKDIQ